MAKRFCLPVLMLAAALSLSAQQDKPVITVLDFTINEVSQAEMKSIIGLLSSAMFKTNFFTVIDVSQRETVLKELQFSMSGCSDESCMLEIGKLLAAEAIVMGSIGRVGSKYVLSAKMLETEPARTLSTADGIYDSLDALLGGIFDVAKELAAPYAGAAAQAPPQSAAQPPAAGTPAKQPARKKERPAAEPRAPREPGAVSIAGIVTLAGGLACAGAGTYFLIAALR
jgi:hypothetical protein